METLNYCAYPQVAIRMRKIRLEDWDIARTARTGFTSTQLCKLKRKYTWNTWNLSVSDQYGHQMGYR